MSFLVDADAYFRAFAQTVARAREQVLILGWDMHSAARLQPRRMPAGMPPDLRGFLNAVVARRRGVRVQLLDWDYSLLFALEREVLPLVRLGWHTHRRIRFHLDGEHPLGACHHQKVVVVDDSVAFVGGLDLTIGRWDTPAHSPGHPDRTDPDGRPYPPFHDVQIALDGQAAAMLGDLARERWRRATGRRLRPPSPRRDVWPPDLSVDVSNVAIAVARTEPAHEGRPEVREVETLYQDAIAAARRWLYIENQYLTSGAICEALASRLAAADGPEVVLVVPRTCSGWLEERTMGALRQRVLQHLHAADRYGRLLVCYPRLEAADEVRLNVHSKVMVVDDEMVRVGSSNLSNRSMGLDTECDVAIEAEGRAEVACAIAGLRDRLLGEHLGVAPNEVRATLAASGSLIATIGRFRDRPRSLQPLEFDANGVVVDPAELASSPVDPERPVAQMPVMTAMVPRDLREPMVRSVLRMAALLGLFVVLSAVWTWTDLGRWASPAELAHVAGPLRDAPMVAPIVVAVVFVVGSALMLPVTGLILATVLLFGPVPGGFYALGGSLVAAAVGHAIGRTWWNDRLRRAAGPHVERVARRLGRRGVAPAMVIRLLPVAPFMVVNLVAGAAGSPVAPFLVGTALGMLPGIVALAVAASTLCHGS